MNQIQVRAPEHLLDKSWCQTGSAVSPAEVAHQNFGQFLGPVTKKVVFHEGLNWDLNVLHVTDQHISSDKTGFSAFVRI